jgi:hypothetical protein
MLVAVTALALAGAAISFAILTGGAGHDAAGRSTSLAPKPAWKAAASFGPLTVERVERGAGGAHASAHEAEPGAVRSDVVRIEVRLGNRLDRPVVFSPGQFRLRVRGARGTISPVDPRRRPGAIAAGQTLAQPLAFIVPSPLTDLTVEFADLETPTPLSIHLGSLAGPTS